MTIDSRFVFDSGVPYQYASNSTTSQMWKITYVGGGYYTIRTYLNPSKYLVYYVDTSDNSVHFGFDSLTNANDGKWLIENSSSIYYYSIMPMNDPNKLLSFSQSYNVPTSPMYVGSYLNTGEQKLLLSKITNPEEGVIWKLASAQPLASTNPNSPNGIKSYKGNTHQVSI